MTFELPRRALTGAPSLNARLLNLLRAARFEVFSLEGISRAGDGRLRILYGGNAPFRHYLKRIAYTESVREEFLGKAAPWELGELRRRGDYDLQLFRSHKLLAGFPFVGKGFFVPEWASGTTDLGEQSRYHQVSRSRQRDVRLLRRNGLSYSVSTSTEELRLFYESMYRPHIQVAHGQAALFMSYDKMMTRVSQGEGELVLIEREGQAVGGSFLVYDQGQPRLFSEGILNHDKALLRAGVGTAVYLFTFEHLFNNGFQTAHMGRSRTFLSDGALYFKQRFGLKITDCSDSGLFLRAVNDRPATIGFLRANPFLHFRGGQLRAALFSGAGTPAAETGRIRKLGVGGIDTFGAVAA